MSKGRKRFLIAAWLLLVFVTAAFLLYLLRERVVRKDSAPVIVLATDEIHVSVHSGEEELLAGVTAMDAEDGDLTDQVVIESISQFVEKGKCIINYAVFDSGKNVSTASRTLYFTDYTSPEFEITGSLEFNYTSTVTPLAFVKAHDCLDGDLTDKITASLLNPNDYVATVGRHPVEFRVMNSFGDVSTIVVDVVVTDKTYTEQKYIPIIKLSQYLVYIDSGELLDPYDFVESITLGNETMSLEQYGEGRLSVDMSGLDTSTPGQYHVVIYSETDGSYVGSANLMVVVRDGRN